MVASLLARTRLRRRIARRVLGAVVAASLVASCSNGEATDAAVGGTLRAMVLRVTYGDTFHVLRGGRDVTIRLIGIDTPEVGWYGRKAECYGAAAGPFLRRRIDGERVRLEFDQERLDPYDRTLAYAHHEGKMLNVLLVRRGYARVTIYEPNDKYVGRLRRAQRAARDNGAGLWSEC
jgi:micrococcal nuclease